MTGGPLTRYGLALPVCDRYAALYDRRKPEVTASADRPVNTVSFKCTNEQMIVADALRATFDPPTHSQSLRWLLSDPEVLEVIAKKVRG